MKTKLNGWKAVKCSKTGVGMLKDVSYPEGYNAKFGVIWASETMIIIYHNTFFFYHCQLLWELVKEKIWAWLCLKCIPIEGKLFFTEECPESINVERWQNTKIAILKIWRSNWFRQGSSSMDTKTRWKFVGNQAIHVLPRSQSTYWTAARKTYLCIGKICGYHFNFASLIVSQPDKTFDVMQYDTHQRCVNVNNV